MASSTHAIFRGLQEHIKAIFSDLPSSISHEVILGLTAKHAKLSDYYYKFDESPLYIWLRVCLTVTLPVLCLIYLQVLDPRIPYDGMKLDFEGDIGLTEYLDSVKLSLHTYLSNNYAVKHVTPSHSALHTCRP